MLIMSSQLYYLMFTILVKMSHRSKLILELAAQQLYYEEVPHTEEQNNIINEFQG